MELRQKMECVPSAFVYEQNAAVAEHLNSNQRQLLMLLEQRQI
jgi:hypothetical protein